VSFRRAIACTVVVVSVPAHVRADGQGGDKDPDRPEAKDTQKDPRDKDTDKPAEQTDKPDGDKSYWDNDHATYNWGGARDTLADHGVSIDVVAAAELFGNTIGTTGTKLLGHLDAAVTLDTDKLGLWAGGTVYVLGQTNQGHGINELVGSATQISNLESDQSYTQLTELFYQQSIQDDAVMIRVGKQDANRDFGTPRFGGNFINNNFGMYPQAPLPSYPTTGLGAIAVVKPVDDLAIKAAVYEVNPGVGGLGLDTAFRDGGGYQLVGGAAYTHHYGPAGRDGGTTSVGVWRQTGSFDEQDVVDPGTARTFDSDAGWFVQNDERIYARPRDKDDPSGLTVITRYGWAQPDRTPISHYGGASLAWHGLGLRHDDTVGVAGAYMTIETPLGGRRGPGHESFGEAFYKWRVSPFLSLQPDVEYYHHPGGDGRDALIAGLRAKVKL